jgi:hypothetical protein
MRAFLFWNLNKKEDLTANITSLAELHQIDVFMFAECAMPVHKILRALNTNGESEYYYVPTNCEKIVIFSKFSDEFIHPVLESDRLTIQHLQLPGSTSILLAVTHLVDKQNWDEDSQNAECTVIADNIEKAENTVEHSRTILVGDLNMNPFQAGVVNARGLHAVMTRNIALEGSRIVQGKSYKFFYNPMWSLFGDGTGGPPGTYYQRKSIHKVYFRNMLDQLLIRPELLSAFDNENLIIIDNDGTISLATEGGYPNKKYSDHFPIKFQLNI